MEDRKIEMVKCTFCSKMREKGASITLKNSDVAICFSCVGVCSGIVFKQIAAGMEELEKQLKKDEKDDTKAD